MGGEVVSAPPSEPPEAFPLREQMHRDIARRQAEYAEAGSLAEAVRRWVADGTLQPAVAEVLR